MPSDCPECFGKNAKAGKQDRCKSCEYLESCKFCAEDDGSSCNRRRGHVSYERYSYSSEIASRPDEMPEATAEKDDLPEEADVRRIMEFLLDIDNYTAELVHDVLHGDVSCASELAKKRGISRQAIHRKIVDCCTEHPELRKLFITRLYRCRRLLTDSRRLTEQRKKHSAAEADDLQRRFDF